MITVYGTAWCEDTRRALRRLRRLGLAPRFLNVDEDFDALESALKLSGSQRRTPIVDLGFGGQALVEPDNDALTAALVDAGLVSAEAVHGRLGAQNVGDVERAARTVAGLTMMAVASTAPRTARWPFGLLGVAVALSGIAGWCPAYHYAEVTSLDGPGDRPAEAGRRAWLSRSTPAQPASTTQPSGAGT